MIKVSQLSGHEVILNAELIETIEATPDTIITLTTGKTFMVREDVDIVVERVIHYRKAIRGFTIWQRQRVEGQGVGRMIGEIEEVRDMSEEVSVSHDDDEVSAEEDEEGEEGEGEE